MDRKIGKQEKIRVIGCPVYCPVSCPVKNKNKKTGQKWTGRKNKKKG